MDKNLTEQIKQKYQKQIGNLLLFLLPLNICIKLTELLKPKFRNSAKENTKNKINFIYIYFLAIINIILVFKNLKKICVDLGIEKEYFLSSLRKVITVTTTYGNLAMLGWLFIRLTVLETMRRKGLKL